MEVPHLHGRVEDRLEQLKMHGRVIVVLSISAEKKKRLCDKILVECMR